jgi:hypothetical protein
MLPFQFSETQLMKYLISSFFAIGTLKTTFCAAAVAIGILSGRLA